MHVLTKIFVVLVSIMAVLLVPLVVVYAYNEDSYKARYEKAEAERAVAVSNAALADAKRDAELNRLQVELEQYRAGNAELEQKAIEAAGEVRRLDAMVQAEQGMKAEIDSKLATLATAMKSSADLTGDLINEIRDLRANLLTAEREKADLDEALRDMSGQLEVAVQARKAIQEELQRLKDELAQARGTISEAVAQGFTPKAAAGALAETPVDRNLDAKVVGVIRTGDTTYAEIDAGQVDGVKVGWMLSVGRGSVFKGKLRIIKVDVNRSTGIVTLEDPAQGRVVTEGDMASARVGMD